MNGDVLLITATFSHGGTPFTELVDTRERMERYMEGLLSWLSDPRFGKIVLVKNCATAVNVGVFKELAESHGKDLEFLTFSGSPKTLFRGKGYGEGEIIRHALGHSRLLRETDSFYKITGKLYCPDVARYFPDGEQNQFFLFPETGKRIWPRRLISHLYRYETLGRFLGRAHRSGVPRRFVAAAPPRMVDTRLYRVNKSFYQKHLISSYRRVQDLCYYHLEHAIFEDIRGLPVRLTEQTLPLIGTAGTTNLAAIDYPLEVKERSREIARRLLAVSRSDGAMTE